MQRKKLHKTLLILLLVLVPPYFLTLTDEGTRVSDNVVLWLFNKEAINLDFKALDSGFRSQEIKKVFPELTWQCGEESTAFGNSLCTAEIGSVNDFPSRYLSTFYVNNRLSALKIRYRKRYHDQILGHLIEQLGQPQNVKQAIKDTPDAAPVLEWNTSQGLVVLKKQLGKNDEPSLFWLAKK